MTGYAVKNLKDVEDQAVKFGLSPELEARFARDDLECEQVAISYQRLAPSARQPFSHKHRQHEELYVVVSGSGRVRLDGDEVDVRRWDVIRVSPETVRAFAAGPDGLELLAFGPRGSEDAELQPPAFD